jgi:hypothetical protein
MPLHSPSPTPSNRFFSRTQSPESSASADNNQEDVTVRSRATNRSFSVMQVSDFEDMPPPYEEADPNQGASASMVSRFYRGVRNALSWIPLKNFVVGSLLVGAGFQLRGLMDGQTTTQELSPAPGDTNAALDTNQHFIPGQLRNAQLYEANKCIFENAESVTACLQTLFSEPNYKYSDQDLTMWKAIQEAEDVSAEIAEVSVNLPMTVDWNSAEVRRWPGKQSCVRLCVSSQLPVESLINLQIHSSSSSFDVKAKNLDPKIFEPAKMNGFWRLGEGSKVYVDIPVTEHGDTFSIQELMNLVKETEISVNIK